MCGDKRSMELSEYLEQRAVPRVFAVLTEGEGETVSLSGFGCGCDRSLVVPRDAIREVVMADDVEGPVEVVFDPDAVVPITSLVGPDGILSCTCRSDSAVAMQARTPTTTVEKCRACGCRYDGWFGCHCATDKRYRCAAGRDSVAVADVLYGV
jgi:hypothetical protein